MAIIYTYPIKSNPASSNDLIIISDSEDKNFTKQIKVSQLPGGSGSGVTSVTNVDGSLIASPTTGNVIVSSASSGTTNSISKWTTSNVLGDSRITDDGTLISIPGADITVSPLKLNDNVQLQLGNGNDMRIYHIPNVEPDSGENLFSNNAGKLTFRQGQANGEISFQGDDGTAVTTTEYFKLDGLNEKVLFSKPLELDSDLLDKNGGTGEAGQVLSSLGVGLGTSWVVNSSGVSMVGTTASGILTRGGTNQADVSPNIIATASQMTFDAGSGNTGVSYDSGTATFNVGGIGGGSDTVSIYSAGVETVTIASTNVHFKNSSTTLFDNGIKFGAAGETLNSYEEGTWTPTSGNANTISSANGDYTRIGDMVFAQFSFTMTGATAVVISGLPFQGAYAGSLTGGVIISADSCISVQGQLKGGQFTGANSFTFNSYFGTGSGLPTQLRQVTSSMYQTAGGTYAGIIIYETSA
tara:strand:- start:250 stop:1653 length:1404 start_codon:yes stop_codon:yes gene_type:complete